MLKREQERGEASCRSCVECRGQEIGEDRKVRGRITMNSMKIPKGQSEFVYRRRTDNNSY
jgi:hypothetical protein